MKVLQFNHVGREKLCWNAPLLCAADDLDAVEDQASREVRRRGQLRSRVISVEFGGDGRGTVFAGFRAVGTVVIVDPDCAA
jgi:hypothetical protein